MKNLEKIIKMMNRFDIEELSTVVEMEEYKVEKELKELEKKNKVRKISKNEYLYINNRNNIQLQKKSDTRQRFNEMYYYFRDFYLLYCARNINISYNAAKQKYLLKNPNINDVPDIQYFKMRLHNEYEPQIIDLYRNKKHKLNLEQEFENKYSDDDILLRSKRTVKERPENLNISITSNLNAIRLLLTVHLNNILENKKVSFKVAENYYEFFLNKDFTSNNHIKHPDLTYDIFISLIHLYKLKNKSEFVNLNIDDFMFIRENIGLVSGFKAKEKYMYKKHFEFLKYISFSINNEKEKNILHITPKTIGLNTLEFCYSILVDKSFIENTEGCLNSKIVKMPVFTRRRNKRMAYFVQYLKTQKIKSFNIKISDLFDELGLDKKTKKVGLEKVYIQDLLHNLTALGEIKHWEFKELSNEKMNRQKWFKNFLNGSIYFEL